jgi:hypothetical protein
MGRQREYTEAEIVAALKKTHGMVYLAAAKVGCTAPTIYNRAKTSEAIANALTSERGVMLDTAENKLLAAIKTGEPWAIQFALKMLGKDRGYAEKPDTLPPPPPSSGSMPIELAIEFAEFLAARQRALSGGVPPELPVVPNSGAAEPGVSQPSG